MSLYIYIYIIKLIVQHNWEKVLGARTNKLFVPPPIAQLKQRIERVAISVEIIRRVAPLISPDDCSTRGAFL